GKAAPFIDTKSGGSAIEYPETLAKAADGITGVETVITGHSAVTDWNAFKEFGEYMRAMVAAATMAKKDGKTAEQAAADANLLPEKYNDYNKRRLKEDVGIIYADLK
ncbi:MAG: hypothetical protein J2P41_07960, partial [Blastocatellia bacterium]|nr:hypothetical protein [Blastocatellia bacterium]